MGRLSGGEPTVLTFIGALCAAAAASLVAGPAPARRRLARVLPGSRRHAELAPDIGRTVPAGAAGGPGGVAGGPGGAALSERSTSFASSQGGRLLAAALAGGGMAVVAGGGFGIIAGAVVGVSAFAGLTRLEPASRVRERERIEAMLPLAADLVTAAIRAGCPLTDAVEHVGRSLGGPLGRAFSASAATARFGSDPARAWSALTDDPVLKPLGRALASATRHGTSPVPALERAAQDAREAARWSAENRARSLGARAAAPLGLCFLPAFVLLGIVPIVASSNFLVL